MTRQEIEDNIHLILTHPDHEGMPREVIIHRLADFFEDLAKQHGDEKMQQQLNRVKATTFIEIMNSDEIHTFEQLAQVMCDYILR